MGEILLLLFIAFVVIGPSDFPKVAKNVIKAIKYVKNMASDIMGSINVEVEDEIKEIKEVTNLVESTVKSINTDNILEPVKTEIEALMKGEKSTNTD